MSPFYCIEFFNVLISKCLIDSFIASIFTLIFLKSFSTRGFQGNKHEDWAQIPSYVLLRWHAERFSCTCHNGCTVVLSHSERESGDGRVLPVMAFCSSRNIHYKLFLEMLLYCQITPLSQPGCLSYSHEQSII